MIDKSHRWNWLRATKTQSSHDNSIKRFTDRLLSCRPAGGKSVRHTLMTSPRWRVISAHYQVCWSKLKSTITTPLLLPLTLSPFLLKKYTNGHCTLPDQWKQYLLEHCWAMLSFVTVRFIAQQCLRSSCNFRWNCVCLLTKRLGKDSDSTLIYVYLWFQ